MSAVIRYTTQDGDRWDLIAHKHYGNALLIELRGWQQANRFAPASGEGAQQTVGCDP